MKGTISDLKDVFESIKQILINTPIDNLLLLAGLLLTLLSFFRFNGIANFSLAEAPSWMRFGTGIGLVIVGLVVFFLLHEDRKIKKTASLKKGITLSFGDLLINLKVGRIQEIASAKDSAVILPVNTSFIDDCITDEKSATGAFCLRFYPDKISKLPEVIQEELQRQGYEMDANGFYPLGTTIILPPEYDTPAKSIFTASTIRKEQVGIKAEPSSICESIHQVFTITADKKIRQLYMPILGSGHGGLDINDALIFILLSLKYYSRSFRHVKAVDILITESDIPKLKEIYRIQYLTLLERSER